MSASDPTWLAGYLYYTGAPETCLTKAVAPFVQAVLALGRQLAEEESQRKGESGKAELDSAASEDNL